MMIVDWLKRHFQWIILLIAGAATGAALIRRKNNAVNTVHSALLLEQSKREIARLRERNVERIVVDQQKANELLKIHNDVEQHKRAIAEIYHGKSWAEMSDAEVQAALRAAGV